MKKLNLILILYLIAAILFGICGLQGKGVVFYCLGFAFLTIYFSKIASKKQ